MLSKWPIRSKLLVGIALLVVIVAVLSTAGGIGAYRYRDLVRSLELRSTELPPATRLTLLVSDLRATFGEARAAEWTSGQNPHLPPTVAPLLHHRFRLDLSAVAETFKQYRELLDRNDQSDYRIDDSSHERETVRRIDATLARIDRIDRDDAWMFDHGKVQQVGDELERLQKQAVALPGYLHQKLWALRNEVRLQYRTLIVLVWGATISAVLMLALFARLFYTWIFRPLRVLIEGSRRVAAGEFDFRIRLETRDEMSELAAAMNGMTERFQAIRDDLDRQVQARTKQVVRSEQLASVGFLAAGVAHEINNPLASIALCAESLQTRIRDVLGPDDSSNASSDDPRRAVIFNYLRMIEEQAFRCKGITERLLDFSRMGELERHDADLRELVASVIEMVRTLGKYRHKNVELLPGPRTMAAVNPQQIKQVVLNLITNGLDSLDPGGTVTVELVDDGGQHVELAVRDNGCGMNDEVLKHLFEPFFTRSRSGQGTGLGLSIAFSIVADHDGHIEAASAGPGRGSQFRVTLPRSAPIKLRSPISAAHNVGWAVPTGTDFEHRHDYDPVGTAHPTGPPSKADSTTLTAPSAVKDDADPRDDTQDPRHAEEKELDHRYQAA